MSTASLHSHHVIRAAEGATIDVSKKRRTITAVFSDDTADHYRTAFLPSGADLATWQANPIIGWEHFNSRERGTLPVANGANIRPERYKGRNSLIGEARFWEDEFSEARFQDYASGRLKGWSIRAIPLQSSPPSAQELRSRPDWGDADIIYRSWRLLEVSATSLPGNPNTLTIKVERSLGGAVASRRPSITIDARAWTNPRVCYAEIQRLRREEQFARVRRQHRAAAGKVPDASKMSDEELHLAIQRLELEAKYYAMLGQSAEAARKRAEQAAHEAAAAERDKALAEFAAGAGKRS